MKDLSCLGVLQTDKQMDKWTDIGDSRVVFATENNFHFICDKQRLCSMDVPVFTYIQNWTGYQGKYKLETDDSDRRDTDIFSTYICFTDQSLTVSEYAS